jgi:hypothetical protein
MSKKVSRKRFQKSCVLLMSTLVLALPARAAERAKVIGRSSTSTYDAYHKERTYKFNLRVKLLSQSGDNLNHRLEVAVRSVDKKKYPVWGLIPSWAYLPGSDERTWIDEEGLMSVTWYSPNPYSEVSVFIESALNENTNKIIEGGYDTGIISEELFLTPTAKRAVDMSNDTKDSIEIRIKDGVY